MQSFKRPLALLAMIISVLMLLLSLASVVGIWIVRPQLTEALVTLANAAETQVSLLSQGLTRLDTVLTQTHDQLVVMEQDIKAFGSDVEGNRPLLNAIVDRLGINISPLVESTREIVTTIRETVGALNAAIETINAFPFVSLPTAELERLDRLAQDLADLQTQVQDLRTRIDQRRGEIIQGTVTIVTVPTSQVISALDTTQASVSAYNQQIDILQDRLYNFQLTIGKWLTGIALLITLILLWSAFSQVWLFLQSWRLYSSQESFTTKE